MKNYLPKLLAAGMLSAGLVSLTACTSLTGNACCKEGSNVCTCGNLCGCVDCACMGAEGRWAIQKQGAFWLGIFKDRKTGVVTASLLWGGGSPVSQQNIKLEGTKASMEQVCKNDKDAAKKRIRRTTIDVHGTEADLVFTTVDGNGKVLSTEKAKAKRIPALPPAPVLSKAEYGETIDLLADGLNGWEAMNKNYFGWSVKDGVLMNRIKRTKDGKRDGASANLKTKRADFEDFKLSYDVRVLPKCNSGVYLRGIYEIQVLDSYGRPVDCHNMAALYGRVTPRVAAEKPANAWQHVDVTLYKRHVTVVLNGVNIIDNQPILGCTGGAITSDEFVPGPIYLQGDHSDADFRNMKLTPIVK